MRGGPQGPPRFVVQGRSLKTRPTGADIRNVRRARLLVIATTVLLGLAASAQARSGAQPIQQDVAIPLFPARSMTVLPRGFEIDGAQALAVAKTSPTVLAIHRREHPLVYQVDEWIGSHYEVFFFFHHKVVADVVVSRTGRRGRTWTGPLIDGVFGRGNYESLFDSPWVFLPFGLLFLLPFIRPGRRLGLRHVDLAALLSFGASYYLFDHTHLEAAVWLFYPPLLYLLARMLMLGRRRFSNGTGLDAGLPGSVLVGGLLILVGARIGLAMATPRVIDVAYASVIGAYRILHGASLYYSTLGHPDTYGPIAYLAYVPFEAIWPWHGVWSHLTAARAAAVTFDVLTIVGLLALGRRLRPGRDGRRLGLLLAWAWAACPFSLLSLMRGSNDGLIAAMIVLVLLVLNSPSGRGAIVGLAAAAKFFPALLLPLVAVGRGGEDHKRRGTAVVAFIIVAGLSVAIFLPPGGVQELYDHTIGYQLGRSDVFSVWALHPTLAPLKDIVELGAIALAALLAFRPRGERSLPQVSALMAAVVIAAQLPAIHWFYFYIVWFLPLVLIAVLGSDTRVSETAVAAEALDRPEEGIGPRVLVGAA
jgi:hypothetical protein